MQQRTIAKAIEAIGIGIHKGKPTKITLEPLPPNSGILFYRSDHKTEIPLSINNVTDTSMATVIGIGDSRISTIEHILSALYAYGVDNIKILVESDEVPIMDGSAISFCLLLDEGGIVTQQKPKRVIRIKKMIEVTEGRKFVRLEPAEQASFDFEIEFSHPAIGKQSYEYIFSKQSFIKEIARARTFGFVKDLQVLHSKDLALGASLANTIGLDNKKILNRGGLRFDNEFVRHKILDAIGDMMVTGYMIQGRYSSFAGSHDLNHKLTKKIFESKDNYEIISTIKQKGATH